MSDFEFLLKLDVHRFIGSMGEKFFGELTFFFVKLDFVELTFFFVRINFGSLGNRKTHPSDFRQELQKYW